MTKAKVSLFKRYIGVDYSGAGEPTQLLEGLQAVTAEFGRDPLVARTSGGENWSRKALAEWISGCLKESTPTLIGIDHGFSFPEAYFEGNNLTTWDSFLNHFEEHWSTQTDSVESCRAENSIRDPYSFTRDDERWDHYKYRLCEKWTSSAKSIFSFDHQGSVAKSTHSGIPWLLKLRQAEVLQDLIHFWPFDGFEVPPDKSVIVEVYPSIFRNRYPRQPNHNNDQHDAFVACRWLQDTDARGALGRYFDPPLSDQEKKTALLEGWILGIA